MKTLSEAIQAARAAHPARLPFALRVGHKSTVELGAAESPMSEGLAKVYAILESSTIPATPIQRLDITNINHERQKENGS